MAVKKPRVAEVPQKGVKAKLTYYFDQFAETTAIQGFDWLIESRNFYEKIIFFALIVIGTALTVKDVVKLSIQYQSEEKQTKASIQTNDSYEFSLTICIGMDSSKLKTPGVNVSDYKSVNKLLNKYAKADMNETFLNLVSRKQKNWTNDERSLISLTTQMLSNIIRVENLADNESYIHENEIISKWGLLELTGTNEKSVPILGLLQGTEKSMMEINRFYMGKNFPFDQLLKLTGAALCKWLEVAIYPITGAQLWKTAERPCNPDQISWLGAGPSVGGQWENVCMKPKATKFDPKSVFNSIESKSANLYDVVPPVSVNGEPLNMLIDFGGNRVFATPTSSQTNTFDLSSQQAVEVVIYAHNKGLSTKAEPCSSDLTVLDCRLQCRANYIAKKCGCWPLSGFDLANRDSKVSLCGSFANSTQDGKYVPIPVHSNEDCGMITSNPIPDPDCHNGCLQNCEGRLMGFISTAITQPSAALVNRTFSKYFASYYQYPFFEQSLVLGPDEFLNQLGGALSLYIGASFIALFHIFVFPMRAIGDFMDRRKLRNAQVADSSHNTEQTTSA